MNKTPAGPRQRGKGVSTFFNDALAVRPPTPSYLTELCRQVPVPQRFLPFPGTSGENTYQGNKSKPLCVAP